MGLLEGFPELSNLDDKKWEDIVEEARILLARYGKEWTDHNIHDPGITFIELFAWLAEMQIYQLNKITDANYEKFLKLVGIYPADAESARVDINFNGATEELKSGDSFLVEIGGEKIYFETQEDLKPVSAKITKIITVADSKTIDNTSANEKEDVYFALFGEKASPGSILKLRFDKSPGETEVKLTFVMYEEDLPPAGSHIGECLDIIPSAKVKWEYNTGVKSTDREIWKELPIKKDTTLAFRRSGRIVFDSPPDMSDGYCWIKCSLTEGSYEILPLVSKIYLNTISAVQIERENEEKLGNGKPGFAFKLRKNPAIRDALFRMNDKLDWITLLKQLKDEWINIESSPRKRILSKFSQKNQDLINNWKEDQEPGDILKCSVIESLNLLLECTDLYDPVSFSKVDLTDVPKKIQRPNVDIIPVEELRILNRFLIEAAFPGKKSGKKLLPCNRLVIRVQEKSGVSKTWYPVEDFESSGPDDTHYIFDKQNNEILFGNGLNGRIPGENEKIKVSYITTLGSKGNIPPKQKFNRSGVQGINMMEAKGGKDAETIKHAMARAKKDCREIYRAITSKDYEELALKTPGLRISRAKAIPDYHPDYPCIAFPGAVSVVVVPYTRKGTEPSTGQEFLRTVLNHLDRHRLVTADVHVIKPEYIKISVKCKVRLTKKSSQDVVSQRIITKLADFLNPITGGSQGKGWPFGRPVYPSEIYQELRNDVEGIDFISNVLIASSSGKLSKPFQKDAIVIPPSGLVISGEHDVEFI
ncbi:MAG: putative baseplate assembly protein [Candidatus Methanoperedens sp.]